MKARVMPTLRTRPNVLHIVMLTGMLVLLSLNVFLHDPYVGYDAEDYVAYIKTLAKGRLPGIEDTGEFFTPPLPFFAPALLLTLFKLPAGLVLKIAQGINLLLALLTALSLLRITSIEGISNHRIALALLTFITLPVFYKTHAFVRAEPYLLYFLILYVEQLLKFSKDQLTTQQFALSSGLTFGAMLLSRQWGILILPAVFLYAFLTFLHSRTRRKKILFGFAISGAIAFIVSGWFYLSLWSRFGSVTAFNREPLAGFSFQNKDPDFYFGTGNGKIFSDPLRESFNDQLIPILYSETWGDYWGYFVFYGEDTRSQDPIQGGLLYRAVSQDPQPNWLETNRHQIASYLGRVNLISLLPSLLLLLSFIWGCSSIIQAISKRTWDESYNSRVLFTMIILFTLIGYLWFLIQYPSDNGDTIKSTYILQIFPFLSLLTGILLDRLGARLSWFPPVVLTVLVIVFAHNIGVFITRFLT
jgi:hypothetical protein